MGIATAIGSLASKALGAPPSSADDLLRATPVGVPSKPQLAPLRTVREAQSMTAAPTTKLLEPPEFDDSMFNMADDVNGNMFSDLESVDTSGFKPFASEQEALDDFNGILLPEEPNSLPAPVFQSAVGTPEQQKVRWMEDFQQEFSIDPKSNDFQKIMDMYVGGSINTGKGSYAYKDMLQSVTSNMKAARFLKDNYLKDIEFDSVFKLDDGTPLVFWRGLVEDPSLVTNARSVYSFRMDNPTEIGAHFGTFDQAKEFADKAGAVNTPMSAMERAIESGKGLVQTPIDKYGSAYMAPVLVNMKNPLKIDKDLGNFGGLNFIRHTSSKYPDGLSEDVMTIGQELLKKSIEKNYVGADGKVLGDTVDQVEQNSMSVDKMLQDIIESKGYDGVQYLNSNEGATTKPSLIAFRKDQIITLDELIPDVKNYNKKEKGMFYSMVGLGVSIDVALNVMRSNKADDKK